ncbi:unnamed protein product (macronuclear) [Paramecium tetraurelia]|uniref:G-protein coupled receptors family 2 profile 2 domain-containing protein n=1 Tax=Paramecium tetraurelia TaxID=5888 RepID=A0CVK1_PARTE|nr:uncharacterized protein GSPATT00010986001 [Paramecium tetraurelia]CAK74818.1 unnamed protein product [Paramecium tetraurelia]|eukprot:XP_001442215.1 hypothetical protein (macronuclear) [Paramecium tetraurelia strain d4-2]
MDEVYQEHCEQNLNSGDKLVNFILRIIILIISILSSLFVLIIIKKSKKSQFWPFMLIFAQVFSELIDLILALSFTINSSCQPQVCKIIAYFMHSNWLASLNFMLFQCFIYFCLIKSELLFNYIMNHLYFFISLLYLIPHGLLFYVLYDGGFGPSGWYLQNGEFNFIFCGCIFLLQIKLSINILQDFGSSLSHPYLCFQLCFPCLQRRSIYLKQNSCYWHHLQNKKGLKYPALRIQSVILFPVLYSLAWIVNFIIRYGKCLQNFRFFETNANNENYCPIEEMSMGFYIFYLFLNLGFELHLTVGAILFYFIYRYDFDQFERGLLGMDSLKRGFRKGRQKIESVQLYLSDYSNIL